MRISLGVNGQPVDADVEPRMLLVHFLRDVAKLTGTQVGCDTTSCGACTVLLDGMAVKSCGLFAVQVEGREITTIEGLAPHGNLNPVQEGFKICHALQCGFCTPGMILASVALLTARALPAALALQRFATTSDATQAISTGRAGVVSTRVRPKVHVTLWRSVADEIDAAARR